MLVRIYCYFFEKDRFLDFYKAFYLNIFLILAALFTRF